MFDFPMGVILQWSFHSLLSGDHLLTHTQKNNKLVVLFLSRVVRVVYSTGNENTVLIQKNVPF